MLTDVVVEMWLGVNEKQDGRAKSTRGREGSSLRQQIHVQKGEERRSNRSHSLLKLGQETLDGYISELKSEK